MTYGIVTDEYGSEVWYMTNTYGNSIANIVSIVGTPNKIDSPDNVYTRRVLAEDYNPIDYEVCQ